MSRRAPIAVLSVTLAVLALLAVAPAPSRSPDAGVDAGALQELGGLFGGLGPVGAGPTTYHTTHSGLGLRRDAGGPCAVRVRRPAVTGPLPAAAAQQVMQAHARDVEACSALPPVADTIFVEFTVTPGGAVEKAGILGNAPPARPAKSPFERCLVKAVGGLGFEAQPGPTRVVQGFDFD